MGIYHEFKSKLNEIKQSLINKEKWNKEMDPNKLNILAKNQLLNDPKWIEAEKIYLTLLDVYLCPPNKYKLRASKFMLHALRMLSDNHDRVDPIAVFNKLPETM